MKRLLLIVELSPHNDDHLARVAGITQYVERISGGRTTFLFKADNNHVFARLLCTDTPPADITRFLTNPPDGKPLALNDDSVLLMEIGTDFHGKGFSRAWTWLQRN